MSIQFSIKLLTPQNAELLVTGGKGQCDFR